MLSTKMELVLCNRSRSEFCVFCSALQMDIDLETSEAFYEKLLQLESEVRKKLRAKQKESQLVHSNAVGPGSP